MNKLFIITCFSTVFLLSSCATIKHGSKQTLLINSIPQGAEVRINDSLIGITPVEVKVPRARRLFIEYTHPEFGTQLYFAPRSMVKKRLIPDFPYWIGAFNPVLLTDLITGAALEFQQDKLNPDLSNANLFVAKANTLSKLKELEFEKHKVYRDSINLIRLEQIKIRELEDSLKEQRYRNKRIARKEKQDHLKSTLKNELSWQASAIVVREINITFLRYMFKNQLGLGVELGYKPESSSNKNYTNLNSLDINGPIDGIMLMPFTESKYVGLVSKFYVDKKTPFNLYISLVGFFRSNNYSNATITWQNQVGKSTIENYSDSLNLDQTIGGLKILSGVNLFMKLSNKTALCLDLYIGIGYRDVNTKLFHYSYFSYYSYSPEYKYDELKNVEETQYYNTITPQLGLKIGLRL